MGLFLAWFYKGKVIALNDIGAASFLGQPLDCVVLAGLVDIDVAKRLLSGVYESEDIRDITDAKNVSIAIVYDSWFGNGIPATWRKAASWSVQNTVIQRFAF